MDRRAFGATGEEKKCPRRRRFFFSHVAEKSRSSSFSLALMPSIYPRGTQRRPPQGSPELKLHCSSEGEAMPWASPRESGQEILQGAPKR